jgi:hypothetical protein
VDPEDLTHTTPHSKTPEEEEETGEEDLEEEEEEEDKYIKY